MTRSRLLRTAAAATLAALLVLAPAALAQGHALSDQEVDRGWLASVWSFLADLLLGGETLDTRCGIDPDGCPDAGAALDTRCTIDPNGACEPGS